MSERPLITLLTPDLRRYFEEHADASANLHILAAELHYRKKAAANQLREEVEARLAELGDGEPADPVITAGAPKPTEENDFPSIGVAGAAEMEETSAHEWDEHQRLIIECDEDEMSLVEAGPGSGKTAVACQRVAHLVEEKGIEASKILLISFTRAAIKELRDRIRSFAQNPIELAGLQIVTLDSFTWQMLHGFTDTDASKLLQGYEGNIRGFVELLGAPTEDVQDFLEELEHVIVDEAQDLVGDRADLALALIDRLPEECGVTVFADSAQAIYGFTTDQETDRPAEKTLVEYLNAGAGGDFGYQQLTNVYRTKDPQLLELYEEGRKQLVGLPEAAAEEWKAFRAFIADHAHGSVGYIEKQCLDATSNDTLVLYRTRAEALMASSLLWKNGVPNKLRMSGIPPRIYPWIARVFSRVRDPYMRQSEFSDIWSERVGNDADDSGVSRDEAWQLLYDNVGQKGGRISLARLRSLLGRDRPPIDFLVDEHQLAGPVLGTIHASKGREARIVHLMLPSERLINDDMDPERIMEEQRVLFVGASRAREELRAGKGNTLYARRLDPSGRTYRMLAKSKGNKVQAEIGRLGDVDVASVVDEEFRNEQEAAASQELLWAQRNHPVELVSVYDHDTKRNVLLTANNEDFVAAFSILFSKDLWKLAESFANERETGRLRPGSKIHFIRQVGVRTAVIPEARRDSAHSPWRESGFVLVPVISGFSPIYLNN